MKPIIIYGAGGHGRVIMDIFEASGVEIAGFVDNGKQTGETLFDIPVYGSIDELPCPLSEYRLIIGIGSNAIRKKIAEMYPEAEYVTAIHPTAIISPHVRIGKGTCVMPGAIINNSAQIGMHCIINSGAIIEHDSIVGDYTHISPGAVLCGTTEVGMSCHIGAGATVRNGIKIGDYITVGCANAVTKDLEEPGVYVGIPVKKISK